MHLAEASRELGGRVSREARLPGLAQWARVRDWRVGQLQKMANVAIYRENDIGAADVLEFGAERVVLATGLSLAPRRLRPQQRRGDSRLRCRPRVHAG